MLHMEILLLYNSVWKFNYNYKIHSKPVDIYNKFQCPRKIIHNLLFSKYLSSSYLAIIEQYLSLQTLFNFYQLESILCPLKFLLLYSSKFLHYLQKVFGENIVWSINIFMQQGIILKCIIITKLTNLCYGFIIMRV